MKNHAQSRAERRRQAAEKKRIQQEKLEKTIIIGAAFLVALIFAFTYFARKGKSPDASTEGQSENKTVQTDPQTGDQTSQETMTISLLGDISFGSNGGRKKPFDEVWIAQTPPYFTQNVADRLKGSDAVVATLKNAFVPTTTDTPIEGKEVPYKAYRRDYVQFFGAAGVTHLNLANNHTGDYGQAGFDQTVAWLNEHGVKTFGTHTMETTNPYFGKYRTDTSQVIEKEGFKVGLLGFMGYNGAHPTADQVKQKTDELKELGCTYILAALNAGDQGKNLPATAQRTYAHLLIDNGVDLVFGSGAHIIQPKEVYKDKTIYYGLGNFFFIDYADIVANPLSLILQVKLGQGADGTVQVDIEEIPLRWTGPTNRNTYQPMVASDQADITAINDLVKEIDPDQPLLEPEGQDQQSQDPGLIPRVTAPAAQDQGQNPDQTQTENPEPGQTQDQAPGQNQGEATGERENPFQDQPEPQPATLKIPRIKANHATIPTEGQGETQTENQDQ